MITAWTVITNSVCLHAIKKKVRLTPIEILLLQIRKAYDTKKYYIYKIISAKY